MKLSVRSKVANGLVLCLLVPRVAATASEMFDTQDDDLNSFAADDEFVLSPETGPIAMIRLNADPAADPSATGDPSGCDTPSEKSTLYVNAPKFLVTTESDCDPSGGGIDPSGGGFLSSNACVPFGNKKLIEVSMNPPPAYDRVYYVDATDPSDPSGNISDEVSISPDVLLFDASGCIPQNIWVTGQNDNIIDGDQPYEINIYDEQDYLAHVTPGVNLDNDNYRGAAIEIAGPNAITQDSGALYIVNVHNFSRRNMNRNNLVIEPSPGLKITSYAASLVSGGELNARTKLKNGVLTFSRVNLRARDEILVSLKVALFGGEGGEQKITVRFEQTSLGLQIDDDKIIRPRLP